MIRIALISLATASVLGFIGLSAGTVISGITRAEGKCERTAVSIRCHWEW